MTGVAEQHQESRRPRAASLRFPYPPYLWTVVRRSVALWVLVRCGYVVVLLIGAASSGLLALAEAIALALHPILATRVVLVALAATLVWWDRWRAHELLLPANLGAWSGWFWIASLLAALSADLVLQTLFAAL